MRAGYLSGEGGISETFGGELASARSSEPRGERDPHNYGTPPKQSYQDPTGRQWNTDETAETDRYGSATEVMIAWSASSAALNRDVGDIVSRGLPHYYRFADYCTPRPSADSGFLWNGERRFAWHPHVPASTSCAQTTCTQPRLGQTFFSSEKPPKMASVHFADLAINRSCGAPSSRRARARAGRLQTAAWLGREPPVLALAARRRSESAERATPRQSL